MKNPRFLLAFLALVAFLVPAFALNAMGTAESETFGSWQYDSESLVVSKIQSEVAGQSVAPYGLGLAYSDRNDESSTTLIGAVTEETSLYFRAYESQLGLAGHGALALYQVGCSSVECLKMASASLFALILVTLSSLLLLVAGRLFAAAFLSSMIFSPWVVEAASNLYWVPWTWLLPAICASLFVLSVKRTWRIVSVALLAVAFIVRFASGYEFLTSIALMAVAIPFLRLLLRGPLIRSRVIQAVKDAVVIGLTSLASFLAVLLVHAYLRGSGSVPAGLQSIYLNDVLRRTYGPVDLFDAAAAPSLSDNVLAVIKMYVFDWTTNVFTLGSGSPFEISFGPQSFWILISACAAIVLFRAFKGDQKWIRDLVLVGATVTIPLSWFVGGKSHSAAHPQVDFILWYLFFLAAVVFVIIDFVITRRPFLSVQSWLTTTRKSTAPRGAS